MFQINTKDINLAQMISNSDITKVQIAGALGMSVQWLNRLLAYSTNKLRLEDLNRILNVIGYTMQINLTKEI